MNIKVDIDELLKAKGEEPMKNTSATDELKTFIQNRLTGLKEEIRKEEKARPCHIMIHLLPPDDQMHLPEEKQSKDIRVTVNGYSTLLTEKIYHAIHDGNFAKLTKQPKGFTAN